MRPGYYFTIIRAEQSAEKERDTAWTPAIRGSGSGRTPGPEDAAKAKNLIDVMKSEMDKRHAPVTDRSQLLDLRSCRCLVLFNKTRRL